MNELLLRIQDACIQLNGWYLVLPGLAAILMGLFLWLGGIRYAFLVVGVLGALVGAGVGFLLGHWFDLQLFLAVSVGAAVFAIIAILLQQIVIVLLAAVIFSTTFGLSYMGHALDNETFQDALLRASLRDDRGDLSKFDAEPSREKPPWLLGLHTSNEAGGEIHLEGIEKLKNILEALRSSAASNRNMLFVWAVIGAAAGLILGYLLKKIVMALCCSIVGSSAVIGGMLALLLAKDVYVFSYLEDRPRLLLSLFAAMVVFGCLLQLLFTGRSRKKTKPAEKSDRSEE